MHSEIDTKDPIEEDIFVKRDFKTILKLRKIQSYPLNKEKKSQVSFLGIRSLPWYLLHE